MSNYDPDRCDICGRKGVTRWTITDSQKTTAVVGLCAQHTAPVEEAWHAGVLPPSERDNAAVVTSRGKRIPVVRRRG